MKNMTAATQAKTINFLLILGLGFLVFFIGGYWNLPSASIKLFMRLFISVFIFGVSLNLHRLKPKSENWRLFFAFFCAAFAFFIASLFDSPLQKLISADTTSLPGIAKLKLVDAFLIIIPILIVTRIAKFPWKDLYLTGGRPGQSLLLGGLGFIIFAVVFFFQIKGNPGVFGQTSSWLPWVLIFVFTNAAMEEIHFRGLLLKPATNFLGKPLANFCISIFFTLVHAPVEYTGNIVVFLMEVFFLSLLWGWLTQKTESIWGSILLHAGSDLIIVAGIVQTYMGS